MRDINRMETVRIRPAEFADAVRIAEIYGSYVRGSTATFETEPPPASEMEQRMRHLLGAGFPYLVAESEGLVVGYAYASAYRPRPAYRFTVEDSLYLDSAFTGHGIGAKLLTALLDICRERGYRQMVAVIGGSDNPASVRLHEKFGFRPVGVLRDVGFKFDKWLDTAIMQREV